MHTQMDYTVLRDVDRRLAELQHSNDMNLWALTSELRMFRQETIHYRQGILARLAKLEETAARPVIDWQPIIQNLWFKLAVLIALASGNTQLVELVTATFQK